MPKFVRVLFLCFMLSLQSTSSRQAPSRGETVNSTASFDWDGDGKHDGFLLHVEKQYDYGIESGRQSKEKFWWYHCWLEVKAAQDQKVIWQDEWSAKEEDVASFRDMADFGPDKEFFQNWFTLRNIFEKNGTVNRLSYGSSLGTILTATF